MTSGILKTERDRIVDANGDAVLLRGTALGGWMLMENFMNGFPGREHQIRTALLKVLGQEKHDFFLDKFLEYFFGNKDAEFLASLNFNCLRLCLNYRHFEDDMNPFVIKEEGFKHVDRVINLCAKYGIYTILDLHALPGGQNQDWHCHNPTGYAAFWGHKHFQDRAINLWEHIARRYKGNPWVAGYNPMNEPADSEWHRLLAFYDRIVPAIRNIDPDHIVFLEGNTFSMDFTGFDRVWDNSVYAIHDYCGFGFPNRIGRFQGTKEQESYIRRMYDRKVEFMKKHNVPIWNGKVGDVDGVKDLSYTPVWYLDVEIHPGGTLVQPLPKDWNAFSFVFKGSADFVPPTGALTRVDEHGTVLYKPGGDAVSIQVAESQDYSARLLLIAGQILDQPIVQHGPFVSTSAGGIRQAFEDFYEGKNGFERAKGWQSNNTKRRLSI